MARDLTSDIKTLSLDDTYLLVAAIDFGTTFSGYAFSFKSSPNDIKMNKNWGAELGCDSYKAPTCVMTNPDGTFNSFGYKAEHEYSQLDADEVEIGGPNGYNLYRHFKMLLHGQKINLESKVVSTTGHVSKAIDIFAMVLKYLHGHIMEPIRKACASAPGPSDIRWVLTVPAIWTDESKGFMREAAHRAGLIPDKNSKRLMFALEPEAASIFCRSLDIHQEFCNDQMLKIRCGEKMLIIDAGGGTVDITAHEVLIDGKVKEIAPPSGGPWGGTKVDDKFISLLAKIFGTDFINFFRSTQPQQSLDFMTAFEKAKKGLVPGGRSAIKVQLPYSFSAELMSFKNKSVLAAVKESAENNVSFNNGYLVVQHDKAIELFSVPKSEIVDHVKNLIQNDPQLMGLNYILLVGGFGECRILQEECQHAFSNSAKVLVPVEAQLAILKGAILFGHNPFQIESRIAKYTYGTDCRKVFDDAVHDPTKRVIDENGVERCEDIFSAFIVKGKIIKTGTVVREIYQPAAKCQTSVAFRIYKTDKANVRYIDEPGVIYLGNAELVSPSGPLGDDIEAQITFGHTEILIEARDTSRGDDFPMKIMVDFLAD